MTDPDDRLRRLYGTLPREEPPPALDAAVLAAARRAVARPSLVRRWGAPVSIAAVLVLVVGVTLEMRDERPGIETSVAPSAPPADNATGPPRAPAPEAGQSAAPAASANLGMQKRAAAEAPAAELERIAKLRAEGKDAEADRALEEFRRGHPGYRIDEAMWERVKPR